MYPICCMGKCILFCRWSVNTWQKNTIFLCVHLIRQKNTIFSVSAPLQLWRDNTNRKMIFLSGFSFFLWGIMHRNFIFNLAKHDFSVHVIPTEKLFLTTNTQNNWIFLSFYFRVYFFEGTQSEKYFFDGIRIFLCVFTHTEVFEFPIVHVLPCYH